MNGKYLMLENEQREDLLYNIADFLWNKGNEVIVQNNFFDRDYYDHFLDDMPCVIVMDENEFSEVESRIHHAGLKPYIVQFSSSGVYTNAIPFPNRLFHFAELSSFELDRFFAWCAEFNLFSKKESCKEL